MTKKDLPPNPSCPYPGRGHFFTDASSHMRESSFPPERLDLLRDQVDIPLSLFIEGKAPSSRISFSHALQHQLENNREYYVDENSSLSVQQLAADTLPYFIVEAIDSGVVNGGFLYEMFQVAASDGMNTACSLVLEAHPFEDDKISPITGKYKHEGDDFKNPDLIHPETGESVYSKCLGMRTAQSIEKELIKFMRIAEQEYHINPTISKNIDIGEMAKSAVENWWHSSHG
jgi:hypothetical protein